MPTRGFLCCLAALASGLVALTGAHAAPPALKVQNAEPVLEELMGGCSLKCSFRWTIESSDGDGKPGKPVPTLNDESARTAWLGSAPGPNTRTILRLCVPKKMPAEMEGQVPVYGLELINGYWKTDEEWKRYGRVKRARLSYNGKVMGEIAYPDSRRWQKLSFPDIMLRSGDVITFEILEIYPGTQPEVALSEIVLAGGH